MLSSILVDVNMIDVDAIWYGKNKWAWFLLPLSWIYQVVVWGRRQMLSRLFQEHFSTPVIVIGNLTVGGVGKTPLVIALARHLRAQGLVVGIVSRGYGGRCRIFPHVVRLQDSPLDVGDEPLLIAEKTQCPVVIAPYRAKAVQYLITHYAVDVVLSDDGLQHYRMGRALEIAVIDGVRGLGNGFYLPAGPLREGGARLKTVDLVVVNGALSATKSLPLSVVPYTMQLLPVNVTHLKTGRVVPLQSLSQPCIAVAGIGHPERFFNVLTEMGLSFERLVFSDHHVFTAQDLSLYAKTILMTEKDAVKCRQFDMDTIYVVSVEAHLNKEFWKRFEPFLLK
jgi:tetraacyldisaccharide 4'-kinase